MVVCSLFGFDWLLVWFLVDLLRYVTRFQWDKAKYPTTMPLPCLKDLINKVWFQDKTRQTHIVVTCIFKHSHKLRMGKLILQPCKTTVGLDPFSQEKNFNLIMVITKDMCNSWNENMYLHIYYCTNKSYGNRKSHLNEPNTEMRAADFILVCAVCLVRCCE